MMNQHNDAVQNGVALTDTEDAVLRQAGVRSTEDLLSLLWNFPTLGTAKLLDFAKLSFVAQASSKRSGFVKNAQQFGSGTRNPPQFAHGANPPPSAVGQPGFQVPLAPPGPPPGGPTSPPPGVLDFRINNWPVRDQGSRGTCVAFSLVACLEHLAATANPPHPELSEQYLFWATKTQTGDPDPTDDGTWIEYARDALVSHGVCLSTLWRYNANVLADVTHQSSSDPSAAAHADATTRKHSAGVYQQSVGFGGNAALLLNALQQHQRPVAISVPVFVDAQDKSKDNWNSTVGLAYGRVFDPPATSIADSGHAVCVTGFVPDATEPAGGWFIFRNSWGTALWGNALPSTPPYYAPEPGYGQISATYVDKFLMEMCCL